MFCEIRPAAGMRTCVHGICRCARHSEVSASLRGLKWEPVRVCFARIWETILYDMENGGVGGKSDTGHISEKEYNKYVSECRGAFWRERKEVFG